MGKKNPKYKVLIVGAGQIGAFRDCPGNVVCLTHAHAFSKHKGFDLVGFVDADPAKGRMAATLWNTQSFSCLDEAIKKEKVDIVCNAVPDDSHFELLCQISEIKSLRIVFSEKPLAQNVQEADTLLELFQRSKIPLCINYSRRFVPEFIGLKERIQKQEFGYFLSAVGYYGKGLLHSGSHLIDLIQFLLGDLESHEVLGTTNDFKNHDMSVTAILRLENSDYPNVFLKSIDCNFFTIFELDMMFSKKRVCIKDTGLFFEEYDIGSHPTFSGYQTLISKTTTKTSLANALLFAADNLYSFLSTGAPLNCSLNDGYKTLKVCHQLKKNA